MGEMKEIESETKKWNKMNTVVNHREGIMQTKQYLAAANS